MTLLCRLRVHRWLYESPFCNCRRCTKCGIRQHDRIEAGALRRPAYNPKGHVQ